jgi:hypothetical protein
MGWARGVAFEDFGGVEDAPEIGRLGLVLAGPDIDHCLQEASRDRHRLMLRCMQETVKDSREP